MKKITLLLAAVLLTASFAFAQQTPLNDFIEKYKDDKAFTFAYLSKELFEVASQSEVDQKDWQKLHNAVSNIGSLRVLASKETADGPALYKEAQEHIPAGEMDILLTVRDAEDKVSIWSKDDGETVTDLVLLVGTDHDFVLVCFTGALELGNIGELGRMFNAGQAEQLANSAKAVSIDFEIRPNPSRGEITIAYDDTEDAPAQLNIADQNGRLVATRQLSGAAQEQLYLSELPAGLYWVQLQTQKGKVGVKQLQMVKN